MAWCECGTKSARECLPRGLVGRGHEAAPAGGASAHLQGEANCALQKPIIVQSTDSTVFVIIFIRFCGKEESIADFKNINIFIFFLSAKVWIQSFFSRLGNSGEIVRILSLAARSVDFF